MARFARVVVPGYPHHVTQRGNRRAPIFFEDGDQQVYRHMLAEQTRKAGVEVWAYCLMPNHVHLILNPSTPDGMARAMGEAHRRYTSFINARTGWTGHLFQGRFASVIMDEPHLISAARYVVLNPVRARLVARAEDWPWSSAQAHLKATDDTLVAVRPLLDRIDDIAGLFATDASVEASHDAAMQALRISEATGRPLGTDDFVAGLEARLSRRLTPRVRGPKPRRQAEDQTPLLQELVHA